MNASPAAPNPEILVERARELVPLLRANAAAAEDSRTLPGETIEALRAAELFRLMQPARFGGFAFDFEWLVRIASELGHGCGSTAWVYAVGCFHSWNIALFSEQAQNDVWGENPEALAASSYLPAGRATEAKGGVTVGGDWPFASGCDHFEWAIIGLRRPVDEGVWFGLVPKGDFRIVDDWHVAGLAGTGSKSVVLDDAFIPDHRLISFEDARAATTPGAALHADSLYRIPFFAVSSYCLVAPALGMARGALDDYVSDVRQREVRSITGQSSGLAGYHAVQMRVAEASGLVDAATLLVLRDCAETRAAVEAGRELGVEQRMRNKRDQALAMRFCRNAMQLVIDATGAKGLSSDQPIQRAWRDLQAASAHITLSWDILMPAHGRVVLGLEPGIII